MCTCRVLYACGKVFGVFLVFCKLSGPIESDLELQNSSEKSGRWSNSPQKRGDFGPKSGVRTCRTLWFIVGGCTLEGSYLRYFWSFASCLGKQNTI